ncbi:MAG TPA: ABC transporter ATP-binding protein [Methanomassiliicoccales archaeon]|nr:ABC transporter ATP-binding protein [Methanomassiliicoccales archaeon]
MIIVKDVSKSYAGHDGTVNALVSANVTIENGEFVLIVGRSGSGKSTLLSILGGLTRPSRGKVELDGEDLWSMSDAELSQVRSREIGFVFQFPGLLPTLNALENVMLPVMFSAREGREEAAERAKALLNSVGLADKHGSYPNQLSGGELKRAAIARALMNGPSIILADEPTGDLDVKTELEIMQMLQEINQQGRTVVMVTHNPDLSTFATRVLRMDKGRIMDAGADLV